MVAKCRKNGLIAVVSVLMSFVACVEKVTPPRDENRPVRFDAGFSSSETRTSYRDGDWASVQPIDWSSGDRIRVFSPEASLPYGSLVVHWSDYTVSPKSDRSEGSLSPVGSNGLSWRGTDRHEFFGVYPPQGGNGAATSAASLEGRFTFSIPEEQILGSQMGYAPLVARADGDPSDDFVLLPFHAAYSAFVFDLEGGGDEGVYLNEVSLEVPSGALSGSFVVAAGNDGPSLVTLGETSTKVTVSIPGDGVELVSGVPTRILLLAVPVNVSQVSLIIKRTWQGRTMSYALPLKDGLGNWYSFAPFCMHRISGLVTPELTKLITVNSLTTEWDQQGGGTTQITP